MYVALHLLSVSVFKLISWVALSIFGVAAFASLCSFIYPHLAGLRKLSIFWCGLFMLDVTGNYMRESDLENHWLYNIYDWILYLGLASLYFHQLKSPIVKTIIKIFVIIFPIFIVIDTFFIEDVMSLQSLVIVLGGNFIIFTAAAYLHQLYRSTDTESITLDPWFWFSVAFIVYFGGSVPYLGMLNYIWNLFPKFAASYYYYIYISFTIILHLIMLKGFLCRLNYQKSPY